MYYFIKLYGTKNGTKNNESRKSNSLNTIAYRILNLKWSISGAPFFFKENKIEIVTVSQQAFCLISMICGFGPLILKHPDI